MSEVTLENIRQAQKRISTTVKPTPIVHSLYLSSLTQSNVFLKLENLNVSGSFKIRGAANALMSSTEEARRNGVIAASAGNHAQGVAYICRLLGAKAHIFMPMQTPLIKKESTRSMGAKIYLHGETLDEAYEKALELQVSTGGLMIHPFANNDVINGQGSIGLELFEQIQDLKVVIVPVGGGGMISGIAVALKEQNPSIKIIGVQTAAYPSMATSFKERRPVDVPPAPSIADGIAVKRTSALNLALVLKYVDDIIVVEEEEIASAIMQLVERDHVMAEGAGATSVAGLLSLNLKDKIREWSENGSVACIISGGNIDVNLLGKITTRGLLYSGRLMRINIKVKDTPGSLADVLHIIGAEGANLLDATHNRRVSTTRLSDVEIDLDLETANFEHQRKIEKALKKADITYKISKKKRSRF